MNSRVLCSVVLSACAVAVLAGCGSNPAATGPVGVLAGSHPHATAVPAGVAAYASVLVPTLHESVSEGQAMLAAMLGSKWSSLARDCVNAAGPLASQYSAFTSVPAPSQAHAVTSEAVTGYKLALSALDECGMAADAQSKSEMATAARDLWSGLRGINAAYATIVKWST
ncbi:MAG TPA: hypothetical protein VKX16_17400 [Chloroflexota bacterium]|nr:hypothetical protein [Chloroflexota bacterium]